MANTYSEKLKDPRWQKKRLEILSRDNWRCTKCGEDKATLHVHHVSYGGDPWEVDSILLVTLCEHCHTIIEHFKEFTFIRIKKLSKEGFVAFTSTDAMIITFDGLEIDCCIAISYDKIKLINQICESLSQNG